MVKVYLLLGGNLGDKMQVFEDARKILNANVGNITLQSSIYETEPWGFDSTDLFWNQALEIVTDLSPVEVLAKTQHIELELGRVRKENQYNSRIIDIDVLFYGEEVIQRPNLVIPHPRIQERKFALTPLNEIAAELKHPVFQKSVGQLLIECTDQLRVEKVSNQGKK